MKVKLLHKKIVWSLFSGGMFYNSTWAYNWQMERKKWKADMIEDRSKKLIQKPLEITVDDIPLDLP